MLCFSLPPPPLSPRRHWATSPSHALLFPLVGLPRHTKPTPELLVTPLREVATQYYYGRQISDEPRGRLGCSHPLVDRGWRPTRTTRISPVCLMRACHAPTRGKRVVDELGHGRGWESKIEKQVISARADSRTLIAKWETTRSSHILRGMSCTCLLSTYTLYTMHTTSVCMVLIPFTPTIMN